MSRKAAETTSEESIEFVSRALETTYGFWGALWRSYLIETDYGKYLAMLSEKRLFDRITEVDIRAQKAFEKALAELKSRRKAEEYVIESVIHNPDFGE